MKAGNIKVIKPQADFEQIGGKVIREYDALTIGVYCKLLCLGAGWQMNVKGLATALGLSQEKVRKAIATLEDGGYIARVPIQDTPGGPFGGYNYIVYGNCLPEDERTHAGIASGVGQFRGTPISDHPENTPPLNNILKSINILKSNTTQKKKEKVEPVFGSQEFAEAWEELIQQPKWKGKSPEALKRSAAFLAKHSEADAIAIINKTIMNGWQGLFELDARDRQPGPRVNGRGETNVVAGYRAAQESFQRIVRRADAELGYEEQEPRQIGR